MRRTAVVILALATLVLSGCRTYHFEPVMALYQSGQIEAAYEEAADPPFWRSHYDHDALIWKIEEGKLLFDLGRYAEASQKLAEAEEDFRYIWEESAKVSVTDEIKSLFAGLNQMSYQANYAFATHFCSLLALSDLGAGRRDQAYTSIVNATNWQKEIEVKRAEELARADELAKEQGLDQSNDLDSIQQSTPELSGQYLIQHFDESVYASAKHDYLNPFALFVGGLVKALNQDASGAEVDWRIAEEIVPNPSLKALLEKSLDPLGGTVYLIYERGLAPARVEVAVPFPTPYWGVNRIAWPRLEFAPDYMRQIVCHDSAGNTVGSTGPLASFDRIVATQFKHELPALLIRTFISAGAREAVDQGVRAGVKDDRLRLILRILVNIWKIAASSTEIRTFRCVGSEYQLAAFPRPADGTLSLTWVGAQGGTVHTDTIPIPEAPATVLYARSIQNHTFLLHTLWGADPSAQTPVPAPEIP
ncbi:MAG: hypothetical protein KDC38_07775 [Planctomycetes bacterium]|nr:hypothetical protein [Planctomycetota bacterium]